MNLLEIRQQFTNLSGRADLINTDDSDNGADFYIKAGQDHLDRLVDIPKAISRVFKDVSSGDYYIIFQRCRSILEVWCQGPDSGGDVVRTPLRKQRMSDLRGVDEQWDTNNFVQMFTEMDTNRPANYSPAMLRMQPDGTILPGDESGGIGGFMDVMPQDEQTYNGVVFLPPSDGSYTIEVVGHFYSNELLQDTDNSFWSAAHPEVLIMAAQRMIEVFHRNSAGIADWDLVIGSATTGIDMDGVLEDISGVTRMNG